MKTFFAFLFFWGGLSSTSTAQENKFVVYSMKGNVSVIENKVETKARIGTLISSGASVKVGPGSFATLICNEVRMFSLTKAGTYPVARLKDSCMVKSSSVSANYVKYIWNELTKAKGSPEKNRKAFMTNVGAVSRSINNIWIDPKLDTLYYVSGTFPLSWKSYVDAEKFQFSLYDKEGAEKPVFTKSTDKKNVPISDLLKVIQPGQSYWWTAAVKGEQNDERKFLRYWTKEEYAGFFNAIKKGDAAETDAEMNFRLGFLLEEAHFLAEAYQHYLKATQLAPDNPTYRFVFMSFKKDFEIK